MMCLLLSRGLSEWALADYIGAQRLGRKSRDNLSKNVDGPESVQRPLTLSCCVFTRLVGRYILRALSSDHRGENENAFCSPRLTKRPSEFHVRSPATLVASGFCKALTHYPCFEHRHDPLCSSSALRRDGDEDAEVFLLRTAPSTGGAVQWNADSDPRVDAG